MRIIDKKPKNINVKTWQTSKTAYEEYISENIEIYKKNKLIDRVVKSNKKKKYNAEDNSKYDSYYPSYLKYCEKVNKKDRITFTSFCRVIRRMNKEIIIHCFLNKKSFKLPKIGEIKFRYNYINTPNDHPDAFVKTCTGILYFNRRTSGYIKRFSIKIDKSLQALIRYFNIKATVDFDFNKVKLTGTKL